MILKTFKQLQDDALRWFDEVDNQAEVRDNIKQAINAAHTGRLSARSWSFMKWPEPVRFTTVVGQRSYVLHPEFFKAIKLWNVTQQRPVAEMSHGTLGDPEEGTGPAVRAELAGISFVAQQPTAPYSVLTVESASSSDGAQQALRVRGELSTGSVDEETITCGTGGAANAGQLMFAKIIRVTKLGTWAGRATLRQQSTGAALLSLRPAEMARVHRTITFDKPPASPEVVEYSFYRAPTALVHDNDIPDIPPPFADMLVYDALIANAGYNAVEKNALVVWDARLRELEQGLLEAYGEAQSLDRETSYVNYIPRD